MELMIPVADGEIRAEDTGGDRTPVALYGERPGRPGATRPGDLLPLRAPDRLAEIVTEQAVYSSSSS